MSSSADSRRAPTRRQTLAEDPAHNGAGAGKDSLHSLAGSTHDVADRRHGAPGVALALHWRRFLRMKDDLTTFVIVGVVAIAGVRVMRVRVVLMRVVLLGRCRSGHGER